MEWKWTKGEPYERSRRIYKEQEQNHQPKLNQHQEVNQQPTQYQEHDEIQNKVFFDKHLEQSAYSSSLHYDEETWNILNDKVATNGFKVSTKREALDQKIADRDKMQQIGFNPFLSHSNYADDITVRDNFLKPMNTTEGRIKAENTLL